MVQYVAPGAHRVMFVSCLCVSLSVARDLDPQRQNPAAPTWPGPCGTMSPAAKGSPTHGRDLASSARATAALQQVRWSSRRNRSTLYSSSAMAASIDKWVYRFGNGSADGCAKDKAFLGGKGECL